MPLISKLKIAALILIPLISLLLHLPHFQKDLIGVHVWRQTQTQATIDHFYEEDFNILNPKRSNRGAGEGLLRMEFPLMQWLVAGIYKLSSPSVLTTRIFMFCTGLLAVFGSFLLIRNIFKNEYLALAGAFALCFSPAFYYYTINPLPDNMALCFGILGLAVFSSWYQNPVLRKSWRLFVSGVFLAIAALCKLPFILFFAVPLITLLMLWRQKSEAHAHLKYSTLIAAPSILPLAWYAWVVPGWRHSNGIVYGMASNRISVGEFFDYLQHNLISTLPELLVNYAAMPFFVAGLWFMIRQGRKRGALFYGYFFCCLFILAYFFFELNMIAKVHDYYLFPFYPMIIILIVYGLNSLYRWKGSFLKPLIILLLLLPFTAYLRMQHRWDESSPGFNADLLRYKHELRAAVPDNALCIAGTDQSGFIMFYYIDKKGWSYAEEQLTGKSMENMIRQGARYIYSDHSVSDRADLKKYLSDKVGQWGSIQVFQLAVKD
jgi:hypothetical protein